MTLLSDDWLDGASLGGELRPGKRVAVAIFRKQLKRLPCLC
jgi:hypothetical protein